MKHELAELDKQPFFHALIAAVPLLIADNATGTIIFASSMVSQMFGYDDLAGHQVEDVVPDDLKDIHIQHRAEFDKHLNARPMGTYPGQLFGKRKHGDVFPLEAGLTVVWLLGKPYTIVTVLDLTETRAAKRARRENELAAIINQLKDFVNVG